MWYCWSRPLCQCYRSITHSLLHTQVQMDQWKFTTARKSQTMTENSVIFIPTPSLRTGAFECARGVVWVSPGNEGSQRKMGMQQFLLRCVTTFPLASFFFFSCTWGEYCRTTLKFLFKISKCSCPAMPLNIQLNALATRSLWSNSKILQARLEALNYREFLGPGPHKKQRWKYSYIYTDYRA